MKSNFVIILLFLMGHFLVAQVVINEACSDNESLIEDEFGEYPDWIELHNIGTQAVDISGWWLSDKENELNQWIFPNYTMQPGEFLIVFASENNQIGSFFHTNFKLSKSGEVIALSNSVGEVQHRLILPALEEDFSFGNAENDPTQPVYFEVPTPVQSNESGLVIERAKMPAFSIESSFQNSAFEVDILNNENNAKIYYTTDGSEPNSEDELYESSILIAENTPLRAIAIIDNKINSPIASKTYFLNTNHTLPIISITTKPENLFDEQEGIFQLGPNAEEAWPFWGANFWSDTEIPVHFEYFDESGNLEIEYDLGARTHGGRGARTKPQKPIRLLANPKFGVNKIEYPFFKNKPVEKFERLVLRNSSGDFNVTHFRDGILSNYLIDNELDIDVLGYQPVVWYINGNYWGVVNLREKSDEYFVESNFGVEPTNIDFLEEDSLTILGDFDIFDQHIAFVLENDMTIEGNFEQVRQYFDLENITDYFSAQFTMNNSDWPQNNLKLWRERSPEGRWRYMLFDLDSSTGRWAWTPAERNGIRKAMDVYQNEILHVDLLWKLWENQDFQHYFINRYADLLNTVFLPEKWSAEVEKHTEIYRPEMEQHFERWTDCLECFSFVEWDILHTPIFRDFTKNRGPIARDQLQEFFGLENQVLLTLRTFPENAGTIQINTIQPENLPWEGYYFNGVPVELTIHPNPGFEFSHWQVLSDETVLFQEINFQRNFSDDDQITAYFESEYDGIQPSIYPNPATDNITLQFELNQPERVDIDLFTINGQLVQSFKNNYLNGGKSALDFSTEDLSTGLYFLVLTTSLESQTIKFVVQK